MLRAAGAAATSSNTAAWQPIRHCNSLTFFSSSVSTLHFAAHADMKSRLLNAPPFFAAMRAKWRNQKYADSGRFVARESTAAAASFASGVLHDMSIE